MNATAQALLQAAPALGEHPRAELLLEIVCGETAISSSGFPYVAEASFDRFRDSVPHLFGDGFALVQWLGQLEAAVSDLSLDGETAASVMRALKVLRTVVFTASVTAPPDLWVLRQVLHAHRRLGTLDRWAAGEVVDPAQLAVTKDWGARYLKADCALLHARGYLRKVGSGYALCENEAAAAVLCDVKALPEDWCTNWVPELLAWFRGEAPEKEGRLRVFLHDETAARPTGTWVADLQQIERGYRLVPLLLALRVLELTPKLVQGAALVDIVPNFTPEMAALFEACGLARDGCVTELGARVCTRGPGPFGIIAAYHPYLTRLEALIRAETTGAWVRRGANVAASQDANRKTFEAGNDRLDEFCARHDWSYSVYIEHAVGRGEATRQRLARSGESSIRYFGADLEDEAIEQAIEQQQEGHLPQNMKFVRSADIGEPARVVDAITQCGLAGEPTVMIVGNGFHEIREQTRQKMVDVFRGYCEAGYVLIFTEESGLSDTALLQTAWNTYHAGFRYVHAISGQGLRPAEAPLDGSGRWTWRQCAEAGGYCVLDDFTHKTRTIFPTPRPRGMNPSISVTYFCVPQGLAQQLRVPQAERAV